jgi:hypothetical protein
MDAIERIQSSKGEDFITMKKFADKGFAEKFAVKCIKDFQKEADNHFEIFEEKDRYVLFMQILDIHVYVLWFLRSVHVH